jgi:hypothetical protein
MLSRRLLLLSLVTATLLGAEVMEVKEGGSADAVAVVGVAPALGYLLAKHDYPDNEFVQIAMAAVGAKAGEMMVTSVLRGIKFGTSTGRLFGGLGLLGGVADADKGSIFDKGVQAGSGASRTGTSGLGLTFCRLVLEAHGGSIDVADREGGGAPFVFHLPRHAKTSAAQT